MTEALKISEIRRNYCLQSLTKESVVSDPLIQFQHWLKEAIQSEVIEPTAMVVSTVSPDQKPSARVLLLKGVDNHGFVFFTNYESRKGYDLSENPNIALTFFWAELERQVRIEGTVAKVPDDVSDNYFHSRPIGSQIGAWVSPQSQEIESREVLERADSIISEKFKDCDVIPRPKHWGGYVVTPERVEFWQGRPNRLHDRILYTRSGSTGTWTIKRLAP